MREYDLESSQSTNDNNLHLIVVMWYLCLMKLTIVSRINSLTGSTVCGIDLHIEALSCFIKYNIMINHTKFAKVSNVYNVKD